MVKLFGIDLEYYAFALSMFALFISMFKDFFLPLIFKPRLKIVMNNTESFVRTALSSEGRSRYARILLKNQDSFFSKSAKQCYVKLLEIRDNENNVIQPFDQAPLNWTVYHNTKNDLAKGESHFIDLVYEKEHINHLFFPTSVPNSLMDNADELLGAGNYKLRIGVYGNNFNSFTKTIKIQKGDTFGNLVYVT
ncbi:hypothetical protein GF327_04410 [Candidatus Woesearchaeota archaeon]|nr:hypothetical protein [Candidatus Woesearchaeota archaeon]